MMISDGGLRPYRRPGCAPLPCRQDNDRRAVVDVSDHASLGRWLWHFLQCGFPWYFTSIGSSWTSLASRSSGPLVKISPVKKRKKKRIIKWHIQLSLILFWKLKTNHHHDDAWNERSVETKEDAAIAALPLVSVAFNEVRTRAHTRMVSACILPSPPIHPLFRRKSREEGTTTQKKMGEQK